MDIQQDFVQVTGADGAWEKTCGPPEAFGKPVRKLIWAATSSQAALEHLEQGTEDAYLARFYQDPSHEGVDGLCEFLIFLLVLLWAVLLTFCLTVRRLWMTSFSISIKAF